MSDGRGERHERLFYKQLRRNISSLLGNKISYALRSCKNTSLRRKCDTGSHRSAGSSGISIYREEKKFNHKNKGAKKHSSRRPRFVFSISRTSA